MPPSESSRTGLLFSYGTLQQGERAQHHLATAKFLGEARTVESFLLVDCGQFPGLVSNAGNPSATPISGELYQVPEDLWPVLDDYEGVSQREYRRTQILVTDADHNQRTVEAYLWAQGWTDFPIVGSSWKTYRRRHYPSV